MNDSIGDWMGDGMIGGLLDLLEDAPLYFVIPFVVVLLMLVSLFVIGFVQTLTQWLRNRSQDVLTEPVIVSGKRQHVRGSSNSSASTYYYITFEKQDRSRVELEVPGEDYGVIAEGDNGQLTHQGSWFKTFERIV
ncbi:DUF2500 domain-containing protein [Paenibacillus sp. WLX2291]|uniref:DUF2500 domain-containing protein n=1 Tax=Paenibacillus sp. WLX2291 TaxID=3296934 RepID=UPI0039844F2D